MLSQSNTIPYTWVGKSIIALLAFTAYLTGTKLIPGIANNIGPFELCAITLLIVGGLYFLVHSYRLYGHPVIYLLLIIAYVASMSIMQIQDQRLNLAIVQTGIVLFTSLLVGACYNLMVRNQRYLILLLRCLTYSAMLAVIWVLVDTLVRGGGYAISGPFRNRAHAGIIMLTSFWIVLVYGLLPSTSRKERFIVLLINAPLILYILGASGRRSTYVAFLVGLMLFIAGSVFLKGKGKWRIAGMVLPLLIGATSVLFLFQEWESTSFFIDRIGTVEQRLTSFTASSEDVEYSDDFAVLQRIGGVEALADHPFLGIGWGGFANSQYSPTGHEMHSTPLRFMAELGLTGIILYGLFLFYLLGGSFSLLLRTRGSIHQFAALAFWAGFVSMSTSHIYNRAVTERTFWLMVAVYISYETLVRRHLNSRKVSSSSLETKIAA